MKPVILPERIKQEALQLDPALGSYRAFKFSHTFPMEKPFNYSPHKKKGGVRPIAVCETIRRLVSRVCCLSVRDGLPDLFLPHGQVGVGVKGGLEAAIHSFRHYLHCHKDNPDLCAIKLDMYNAFNEVDRASQLENHFPGIYPWVRWCYQYPSNLQLGPLAFRCSKGVQQGDPLGPLLFSLVLLDFMNSIDVPSDIFFQLWYLDDGTFAGTRPAMAELLKLFCKHGPSFGLTLNLKKCEVFWPSGDSTFPDFPPEVCRPLQSSNGVELLGAPIFGSSEYFDFLSLTRSNVCRTCCLSWRTPGGASIVTSMFKLLQGCTYAPYCSSTYAS